MDPFNKWFGYKIPQVEAEVVTTSHSHKDHNYIQAVKGNFHHLDQTGSYTHKDIAITGMLTYHDNSMGAKRGKKVVYVFSLDGIRVCHCGDRGHLLSPDQLSQIGKVDVLLLPVGGSFAITVAQAQEVREQLHPAIMSRCIIARLQWGWVGCSLPVWMSFCWWLAKMPAR